jgi:hypothetical protein
MINLPTALYFKELTRTGLLKSSYPSWQLVGLPGFQRSSMATTPYMRFILFYVPTAPDAR